MGIENMRRWPMYIVFAVCILLTLSLFNSWGLETELRTQISEISTQLQECSKQQSTCMEDSISLLEQKETYVSKTNELEKQKKLLDENVKGVKEELAIVQKQYKRSIDDVKMCNTGLASLKDLELTKTASIDTLRKQLTEKKEKIGDLEKEIVRLKLALNTVSLPPPSPSSKITPAAAPPNQSPSLQVNNPIRDNPIHEQVLENNDAKEDLEDTMFNDGNVDFDPQPQN